MAASSYSYGVWTLHDCVIPTELTDGRVVFVELLQRFGTVSAFTCFIYMADFRIYLHFAKNTIF